MCALSDDLGTSPVGVTAGVSRVLSEQVTLSEICVAESHERALRESVQLDYNISTQSLFFLKFIL